MASAALHGRKLIYDYDHEPGAGRGESAERRRTPQTRSETSPSKGARVVAVWRGNEAAR